MALFLEPGEVVVGDGREVETVGGGVGQAVTALIEREDAETPLEMRRNKIPDARIRRQAVQQHERPTRAAPIQIMETQAVEEGVR